MNKFKKIFNIIQIDKKFLSFFFLVLISSFFDLLGVASVYPFITLLLNTQLIESNKFLNFLYQASSSLGVQNISDFLIIFGGLIFFLNLTSLFFRALTNYVQNYYMLFCEYNTSKRLIRNYLNKPYVWFLSKHSSDLEKNILSEVTQVMNYIIFPFINILAQSILILGILTLLVFLDPILIVCTILIIVISYRVIFYFLKNILIYSGSERFKANESRFRSLVDIFGATKEIKIKGLEETYIDRFNSSSLTYLKSISLVSIISQIPRYIVEAIAIGGMILISLFLISSGKSFESVIAFLSVLAFAGYRLIPSIHQIYSSITQIKFSDLTLNSLHKDLFVNKLSSKSNTKKKLSFEKSILLKNISFAYPNTKYSTIQNINFTIPALSKVAIVGATGSGKTTIVDIILSLLDPSHGNLIVDGKIINNKNKRSWQNNIGYVPQQIYLSDESIAKNIAFGLETNKINYKLLINSAKIANLHNFIMDNLPDNYDTKIGERGIKLSGGQRQRIGIARALYYKPKLLILDEATNSLDSLTEKIVMEAIENLMGKITIILITHRLNIIKDFDLIIFLEKGKLRNKGNYKELYKNDILFKKMAGVI
jgi:ABC-type multidrug transport system fused ATPase/permease subunit